MLAVLVLVKTQIVKASGASLQTPLGGQALPRPQVVLPPELLVPPHFRNLVSVPDVSVVTCGIVIVRFENASLLYVKRYNSKIKQIYNP